MGAFTFLFFSSNHGLFVGTFIFHGVAWRFNLLRYLEETSADWLRKCMRLCIRFTGFAYVYGFCVCIPIFCMFVYWFCVRCAAIAYEYGFCARWAAFAYVYGLSFAHVVWILHTYMAYLQNVQMQTVSRDPILRVPWFILSVRTLLIHGKSQGIRSWGFRKYFCPRGLLVIIGQSWGSNLEGSVDFFVRASCSWFTVWSYLRGFFVVLDRAIYFTGGVILLCTILLWGSYINVSTKGALGVTMIS